MHVTEACRYEISQGQSAGLGKELKQKLLPWVKRQALEYTVYIEVRRFYLKNSKQPPSF